MKALTAMLLVVGLAISSPAISHADKPKKEDPAASIKQHWTNIGAYTYSWKCDLENTDHHRKIAVVVSSKNDKDPLHPITSRYEMGPHTFQTVGMFMFN